MPGMYAKHQPVQIEVGQGDTEREIVVRMPVAMGSGDADADRALAIRLARHWLGRDLPESTEVRVWLVEPDRETAVVTITLPEPRSYTVRPGRSTSSPRAYATVTERVLGRGGWNVRLNSTGDVDHWHADLPQALTHAAVLLEEPR